MIALLSKQALRLKVEVVHIRLTDFMAQPQVLKVGGGKAGSRVVPMEPSVMTLVREHVAKLRANATPTEWLFPTPHSPDRPLVVATWTRVIRTIGERANVPKLCPSALRYRCLMNLAMAGWKYDELMAFAGYRNPNSVFRLVSPLHLLNLITQSPGECLAQARMAMLTRILPKHSMKNLISVVTRRPMHKASQINRALTIEHHSQMTNSSQMTHNNIKAV